MNTDTIPTSEAAGLPTPFEAGNGNQTTTWEQCIDFYQALATRFPKVLRWFEIGLSDCGQPIHAGVVTRDGVFDRAALQRAARPVFFNNNGIHPGEPEGIDACMALVRDFCTQPRRLAELGHTVFLFIPVYNVDGCRNRGVMARVNQVGPEVYGFRGNDRGLDLNRDFIKADSLAAQGFNRFFTEWDPDVMVDTHTSNGADYAYTMTLIHTQTDKLGAGLGAYLRDEMLPAIYPAMAQRGWPTCPYVHPVQDSPEQGIAHMLDVPRFSTGYAALHDTVGFMPETHMLKPFADRYAATRALVEVVLALTVRDGAKIRALRQSSRLEATRRQQWPVAWRIDHATPSSFRFKGFKAVHTTSRLGHYLRLAYDRSQPWERDIAVYDRCVPEVMVDAPRAYLVPQAWREVIERLLWNGVRLQRAERDHARSAQVYRIESLRTRPTAFEGHMFHDGMTLSTHEETVMVHAGDCIVALDQPRARYAVETLEPQAHDSFFRWGFFNSLLEKKERYSDYLFEDTAFELLRDEPQLRQDFEDWKAHNPALLSDQKCVLDFLFTRSQRYREPQWKRYPVARLTSS